MGQRKKIIAGIWDTEHDVVEAAKKAKAKGYEKLDVISPYPLHGIDDVLGIPRSFIPYITFVMGLAGCAFGTWFTWYVAAYDWPLNIGGKPMWSLAAFIPVIFETTVLFAALSSVGAMIVLNGLPTMNPPIIDHDLTSHRFALFLTEDDSMFDPQKVEGYFKELGAKDVKHSEF